MWVIRIRISKDINLYLREGQTYVYNMDRSDLLKYSSFKEALDGIKNMSNLSYREVSEPFQIKEDDLKNKLLLYLEENPGTSITKLMEITGHGRTSINSRLVKLIKAKKITVIKGDSYSYQYYAAKKIL
jgi:predicted HTH transcriptional regulator